MRLGQWVGFLALIISIYILWRIHQVLLLAFTAVILATVINQLVKRLEQKGLHRGFGIAVSITTLLVVFAVLFALIIPPFFDQLPQLISAVPQGLDQLRVWIERLSDQIPGQLGDGTGILTRLTQQLPDFINQLFGNFYSLFTNSVEIILSLLLVLIVTIMLLASPNAYRRVFLLIFPKFYRQRVNNILLKCEVALTGWLIGILFNMTVIAVFSGLGLWLLGVPLPLANASLAGLLTFIPNLGPTLSVIPPAALALLESPWKALAVIGLYVLIQQVESNILTPLVMRHQVSLLPAITLLSQLAFSIFFGFMGLLLALPLLVVAQVCLKEVLVEDIMNDWQKPSEFQG
ncbi:AI-2E family transporter [Oscillatoria sp. FACHB-1407]|uniref:AI-2E family transporter n=1 Tax=Oscillatoria sp. FACHB-1407 TaxID=2692847 RepID=UPI0016822005|nr:AI-2E family transporter [Oscillatoria sp. FACHB-1407]MBD2465496.1 AI-2E family transporter [Oscillatoria sp. FACHB-1407]